MSTQEPPRSTAEHPASSSRAPTSGVSGTTIAIWAFAVVEAIGIGWVLFSML